MFGHLLRGAQLFQAAVLRGLAPGTRVVATCDGGNGLKEELEVQFPHLVFILDRFHLKQHLYETAAELGLGEQERGDWVSERTHRVGRGDVDGVIEELRQRDGPGRDRAHRLAGYLDRFRDAVAYDAFAANDWPIGSGEVESGHRSVPQKRLKLPGACWHPDNLNPMLALRALRANGWWDEFWEEQRRAA